MKFTINKSSHPQIYDHLLECNNDFIPPLDSKVNLKDYSNKINTYSTRFEAWEDKRLIGLVAVYVNDFSGKQAFVTNVSVVKQFSGKGIAGKLLANCIEYARNKGFVTVCLEVSENNQKAIDLYTKFGFRIDESKTDDPVKLLLQLIELK